MRRKSNKIEHNIRYALAIGATVLSLTSLVYRVDTSMPGASTLVGNVVGVTAQIPPNELSRLAQQFDEKDKELSAREAEIADRERALNALLRKGNERGVIANYAFAGALLLLFILVGINFYQDWKGRKIPRQSV